VNLQLTTREVTHDLFLKCISASLQLTQSGRDKPNIRNYTFGILLKFKVTSAPIKQRHIRLIYVGNVKNCLCLMNPIPKSKNLIERNVQFVSKVQTMTGEYKHVEETTKI